MKKRSLVVLSVLTVAAVSIIAVRAMAATPTKQNLGSTQYVDGEEQSTFTEGQTLKLEAPTRWRNYNNPNVNFKIEMFLNPPWLYENASSQVITTHFAPHTTTETITSVTLTNAPPATVACEMYYYWKYTTESEWTQIGNPTLLFFWHESSE